MRALAHSERDLAIHCNDRVFGHVCHPCVRPCSSATSSWPHGGHAGVCRCSVPAQSVLPVCYHLYGCSYLALTTSLHGVTWVPCRSVGVVCPLILCYSMLCSFYAASVLPLVRELFVASIQHQRTRHNVNAPYAGEPPSRGRLQPHATPTLTNTLPGTVASAATNTDCFLWAPTQPQENHHLAAAFSLMRHSEFAFLANMPKVVGFFRGKTSVLCECVPICVAV